MAYDRAWNTWEIGEIFRVRGDMAASRQWYESARPLFEANGDTMGLAFARRAQAELELYDGLHAAGPERAAHFSAADDHFRAYLAWTLEARNTWSRTYALCGLGRVELATGALDAALEFFREALGLARTSGRRDLEGLPLACVAHLANAAGHSALAARLAAAVIASPFSWLETRAWVAALAGQEQRGAAELESRATGAGEAARDVMGPVIDGLLAVEGATAAGWLAAAAEAVAAFL